MFLPHQKVSAMVQGIEERSAQPRVVANKDALLELRISLANCRVCQRSRIFAIRFYFDTVPKIVLIVCFFFLGGGDVI